MLTRRATSTWLVLLAATLLIAPHAADLQALAAPAAIPPEPGDLPQPAAETPDLTTAQTPRYTQGGRRSVLVAGGDYADFPGRAGHNSTLRAWLCPDGALRLASEGAGRRLVGAGTLIFDGAATSRLLDRGPPA
ncbi:MAG: hypothetical protein IT323_18785 [Anaerolineae bacterium]|nr:hypothetical protein [Anaerolineae bacterium]